MKDEGDRLFASLQRAAESRPAHGKRPRKDTFVQVPLWWIEAATKATENPRAMVCIWLLHLAWKTHSMTFPIPNAGLAKRGVDRRAKYRVLRDLEASGLITVDRRSGKTPVVTLVCL